MIGGYIYNRVNPEIAARLRTRMGDSFETVEVWGQGFFWHEGPRRSRNLTCLAAPDLMVFSEDLLAAAGVDGEYRPVDPAKDLRDGFLRDGPPALNAIGSDFRMALARRAGQRIELFLCSNRAGSGRIYYHKLEAGILFSTDLRFLLEIIPLAVSSLGFYAVLKYGAIPEPLTISENISAVPPAHCLKFDLESGGHAVSPYYKFQFSQGAGRDPGDRAPVSLSPVRDVLARSSRFLRRCRPAMLLSGGIDSSLYSCYLSLAGGDPLQAFYCAFGEEDPEYPYARSAAERAGAVLHVAVMGKADAPRALDETVRATDHPFSDFSSLPITFILRHIKEHASDTDMVIECNGADDCFGFAALGHRAKHLVKHRFPNVLKRAVASGFKRSPYWKLASFEGALARLSALADVHESTPLDYFLVLAPMNYLGAEIPANWDEKLQSVMGHVFSNCEPEFPGLDYRARLTVRQLLHVNSRRWAAKALSVGESFGIRVVYPFIWQDVLAVQVTLPWSAKINDGVVKWPLKKLLEEFMPADFIYRKKSGFVPPFAKWLTIREFNGQLRDVLLRRDSFATRIIPARIFDELLADAMQGRELRAPVLNFLWGAVFTELWIAENQRGSHA